MPANPWQLRADLRALDRAADSWTGIGRTVASRADELVEAARRAIDGWDAEAAESYDAHRRQVLAHLDRFTALAASMAGALRTVSAALSSSQDELDRSWSTVALVPHREVGESRHLVFDADDDEKRSKVDRAQAQAQEIRGRLTIALAQEDARIRSLREELALVRADVTELAGGAFGAAGSTSGGGTAHAVDPGGSVEGAHGLSALSPGSEGSTSVAGSAQTGRALGLPPIAPISVSVADLGGLPATGLGGVAGAAVAAGLTGRRARRRTDERSAAPPMGGMAAGAMGARAGSAGRPTGAGGAAGVRRMPTPRLEGGTADDEGREKDAVREAKREALAEKRAERAARKAEREAERQAEREARQEADESAAPGGGSHDDDAAGDDVKAKAGERPAAITVVEVAPGEQAGDPRR